jgi:hypothetical protein
MFHLNIFGMFDRYVIVWRPVLITVTETDGSHEWVTVDEYSVLDLDTRKSFYLGYDKPIINDEVSAYDLFIFAQDAAKAVALADAAYLASDVDDLPF